MSEQANLVFTKTFHVGWEAFHRDAKQLAWKLFDLRPFEGVIAITRGGLVPSAIVARELDIRAVETVGVISYLDGAVDEIGRRKRGDVQITKCPATTRDGTGWVIIDDLVDTGETAKAVRDLLPRACFATVYAKPAGRPYTDVFVAEMSQDTWIHFPWDLEPRPAEPIISIRRQDDGAAAGPA